MRIGEYIGRLRAKERMTQRQLADYWGVTTQYVSLVELGRTSAPVGRVRQALELLGGSADKARRLMVTEYSRSIREELSH